MNQIDRTDFVLQYSQFPEERQSLLCFPRIAKVLEWHAVRDESLSTRFLGFSDMERDVLLVTHVDNPLPVAMLTICEKVKMWALSFFIEPLRNLFWLFNSHIQVRDETVLNEGCLLINDPQMEERVSGLVDSVTSGSLNYSEALNALNAAHEKISELKAHKRLFVKKLLEKDLRKEEFISFGNALIKDCLDNTRTGLAIREVQRSIYSSKIRDEWKDRYKAELKRLYGEALERRENEERKDGDS